MQEGGQIMAFGLKWLRPEIDQPVYYIHIAIILAVIYGVMLVWKPTETWGYVLSSGIGLFLGDIIAHTVLKLD